MHISTIEDIHEYDKLKPDWDAAYQADPHAHIFVSWAWLRGWFEATSDRWLVLAFRPDEASPYTAFLPLSHKKTRMILARELQMGGNPLADYTGFVCSPEYEDQAIGLFVDYLGEKLKWDIFHLKDVMDPRLVRFLELFTQDKYAVEQIDSVPCPYIELPESSWDQYLADFLSIKSRQQVRRYTRKVEALDQFRITHVQADNLDNQIETLLKLWKMRWGLDPYGHQGIFHRCFENDNLWLTVLWQGHEPISALAAFMDHSKGTFAYYISGFDKQFSKVRPGRVMVAYSIKYALENGFKVFDFLRGDEPYKYTFGAKNRFSTYHLITRRSPRSVAVTTVKRFAKRLQGE